MIAATRQEDKTDFGPIHSSFKTYPNHVLVTPIVTLFKINFLDSVNWTETIRNRKITQIYPQNKLYFMSIDIYAKSPK